MSHQEHRRRADPRDIGRRHCPHSPARPPPPGRSGRQHRATGQAWLEDGHGGLGIALRDNRYFVSDTNYGRGTDKIGGPNEIVMFKSCFPNSQLRDDGAPVPAIADNPMKGPAVGGLDYWAAYTVANAKGIYLDLLQYFGAHPEKLFVAVVAPPVTSPDTPGGGASDVGLSSGNHHRVWNGAVQHETNDGADRLAYPRAGGDSHPSAAGAQKVTAEFVPLLNAAYNAWKDNGGGGGRPKTVCSGAAPRHVS